MRKKFCYLPIFLFFALAAGSASADTLGETRQFYADASFDYSGRTRISAVLKNVSERAYFYADADYFNSLDVSAQTNFQNNLASLASSFDGTIYPKLVSVFGAEPNPGIDGDSKITVLLERMPTNVGGYFINENGEPKSNNSSSNEREMFYLNATHLSNGNNAKTFAGHEFQHLITFNQKNKLRGISEDVWLNESRSEAAPTIAGFDNPFSGSNLESRLNKFLENPNDSLVDWGNSAADYASANMFGQYLLGRFGESLFSKMTQSGKVGIESVDDALAASGVSGKLDEIFADFVFANFANDCSLSSNYCYANANLKNFTLPLKTSLSVLPEIGASLEDKAIYWSNRGYKFFAAEPFGEKSAVFQFESEPSAKFSVPYILSDYSGKKTAGVLALSNGNGEISVSGFGSLIFSATFFPFSRLRGADVQNGADATPKFALSAGAALIKNPSLHSFSRIFSLAFGGDKMTISGANFQTGARVYFGDIESPSVKFIDSGTLEVEIPAIQSGGEVYVSVKNPDGGSASFSQPFKYFAPRQEGSLIRARGASEVYIVKGKYRRHILDAEIFRMYGHLNFAVVADISGDEMNLYQKSNLIRLDGDRKVYEVSPEKTKKWLNMSGQEFLASGRSFDAVYIVNEKEFGFYR